MASGKKGNTWHFGMKMHVATDTIVGIATDVVYGPANEHDISRARELISSDTEEVYGDAGYLGSTKETNSTLQQPGNRQSATTTSMCAPARLRIGRPTTYCVGLSI